MFITRQSSNMRMDRRAVNKDTETLAQFIRIYCDTKHKDAQGRSRRGGSATDEGQDQGSDEALGDAPNQARQIRSSASLLYLARIEAKH